MKTVSRRQVQDELQSAWIRMLNGEANEQDEAMIIVANDRDELLEEFERILEHGPDGCDVLIIAPEMVRRIKGT